MILKHRSLCQDSGCDMNGLNHMNHANWSTGTGQLSKLLLVIKSHYLDLMENGLFEAFNLVYQMKYILNPWCMPYLPAKAPVKVLLILFKFLWPHCGVRNELWSKEWLLTMGLSCVLATKAARQAFKVQKTRLFSWYCYPFFEKCLFPQFNLCIPYAGH